MAGKNIEFGPLKNEIAELLTRTTVRKVAHFFELPPAVRDRLEMDREDLGLYFVGILEERGIITSRDLSVFVASLDKLKIKEIAEKTVELCHEYLGYVKAGEDFPPNEEEIKHDSYPFLTKEMFDDYSDDSYELDKQNSRQQKKFDKRMSKYQLSTVSRTEPGRTVEHIKIVMVGKTGSGKSSTANSILGSQRFERSNSSVRETIGSCVATGEIGSGESGRRVTVVDTPGLKDTQQTDEETFKEIARIAYLLRDGVHAFAFVRNAGNVRYDGSDEDVFRQLKDGFGNNFEDHCFLVFSRADSELKECDLDEFVANQRRQGNVRKFLDEMEGRIVAVDNTTDTPAEKQRNQNVITEVVDHILHKTENRAYSNDLFQKAREQHRNTEEKARREGCHPALVSAVVELFDSHISESLTDEEIRLKVLALLKKSKTGSFNSKRREVTLIHGTEETVINFDEFRRQTDLVFRELTLSLRILIASRYFIYFTMIWLCAATGDVEFFKEANAIAKVVAHITKRVYTAFTDLFPAEGDG